MAGSLVAAVDQLRGPLVDRRGERAARGSRRKALWTELRAGLAGLGLDREPWCEAWTQSVRSLVGPDPTPSAARAILEAARCLATLGDANGASCMRGRVELAAQIVGDSHGLDDDSLAGTMVLRGIAARVRRSEPGHSRGSPCLVGDSGRPLRRGVDHRAVPGVVPT